ncbi:MAG: nucleoside monophosphate kinase [Candidatus Nomurabacteria bacterium]|jgi:adenylate kinase|nr:nucleoside monophosphate kinase [Candidatus Nomurabacteria bacterium]
MENEQLNTIKTWLGSGSVNLFGLPFAGKDTVGIKLAEIFGGRFLSSGMILREHERENKEIRVLDKGFLVPSNDFREIVLPYLASQELVGLPLFLSSFGRWDGEQFDVLAALDDSQHVLKAVILLNVSENEIKNRWETAKNLNDRGEEERVDDRKLEVLETRISEFTKKTMPVVEFYKDQGVLIPVNAHQSREAVVMETLKKLYAFAMGHPL